MGLYDICPPRIALPVLAQEEEIEGDIPLLHPTASLFCLNTRLQNLFPPLLFNGLKTISLDKVKSFTTIWQRLWAESRGQSRR